MPIWFDGVEIDPRVVLAAGDRIQISDMLATDLACTGKEIVLQTAGEILLALDVAYFKSDGKWWRTDASGAATSQGLVGLATRGVAVDASLSILLGGYARNDTWSFSVGVPLFLSESTPGGIVETPPSGSGEIVRVVGYSVASNIIWFEPSGTFIQIA